MKHNLVCASLELLISAVRRLVSVVRACVSSSSSSVTAAVTASHFAARLKSLPPLKMRVCLRGHTVGFMSNKDSHTESLQTRRLDVVTDVSCVIG